MAESTGNQMVILRFLDGKVMKGYMKDFTIGSESLFIEDGDSHQQKVRLRELKAIFFVKKFEGDPDYREKKSFTGTRPVSKRAFVKFKDGEALTGYLDGSTAWDKGFFLEARKEKGFYLIPVDEDSNNTKIFIITSAVQDVAMIGG